MKGYVSNGSMSLPWVLAIIFSILKLTDVISWPWLWVLSPIWITFLTSILAFVIIVLFLSKKD